MADRKADPKPEPKPDTCNLPHCRVTDDLTLGLCPVHWSTHRGLANENPEAPKFDPPEHPEVALP